MEGTTYIPSPEPVQDNIIKEVVSKERSRLLDFIRRRIPTSIDAEDILQDVFYELVETYRLMKPVEQLASWLFHVARNKITDMYRKSKPDSLEEELLGPSKDEEEPLLLADLLDGQYVSADTAIWQEAVMDALSEALDELPEEQKEVFVLHELEDWSFKDIEAFTGVNTKTLISRKRYAVTYLRERLQYLYNDLLIN